MDSKKIRVAVVGVGAFGKNHARVYHDLQKAGEPVELVAIVDADVRRGTEIAVQFETSLYSNVEALEGKVDAASIAVPTVHHLEVARRLMERGIDVLIEKPIAASLAEAGELITLSEKHKRIGMVGHLERFNPGVQAALPVITQPMFFEIHRLSIFGPRALDVDVVLDLMIHDLDIVLTFVKSPVKEVRAVGLPILSNKVDISNVRLEFENGCIANFTASRVSTERVRKLRFFQPHQYVSIDYTRQDVIVFTVSANDARSAPSMMDSLMMGGEHPSGPDISMSKPAVTPAEPLKSEIQEFLAAVRERREPMVSFENGRRALALALEVNRAMQEHHQRARLDEIYR